MSFNSLALSRSVTASSAARLGVRLRTRVAVLAAVATVGLAWGALALTHTTTPLAVPAPIALRHALIDQPSARLLDSVHWTRWDVTPMDSRYEILGFYRGSRMVASVTVGFKNRVVILDTSDLTRQRYAYGSNIANDLRVLTMLSVLFITMTAVWPLWRLRNLDVMVATSTVLSIALFNRSLLTWMVIVSYPALIYLAVRCAFRGLGRQGTSSPEVPLYDHLTRRWTPEQQSRVLRFLLVALALIMVMVGLTSLRILDVGYAVMEGATIIAHGGGVPYGHIPDVLHGDTYPFGSYLLYVPFAWLWPVHTVWDNADVTLAVAVAAGLLIAAGIWGLTGRSDPGSRSCARPAQLSRLRLAIAVLTFPPVLVTVSTGTTDVALAGILVAVLLLWRRPSGATTALSAAAWFKLAPVVLLPLWLARLRGRALVRALGAVAFFSAGMIALLVALGGSGAPMQMLRAISFQFTRSSPHTLWSLVGSVPLQQLAEAATLGLVVGASVRLRRDRALGGDPGRVAAIAAAALLGLQVSASYWNYMYLVWILPFILLALFAESPRAGAPSPATSPDFARFGAGVSSCVQRS